MPLSGSTWNARRATEVHDDVLVVLFLRAAPPSRWPTVSRLARPRYDYERRRRPRPEVGALVLGMAVATSSSCSLWDRGCETAIVDVSAARWSNDVRPRRGTGTVSAIFLAVLVRSICRRRHRLRFELARTLAGAVSSIGLLDDAGADSSRRATRDGRPSAPSCGRAR